MNILIFFLISIILNFIFLKKIDYLSKLIDVYDYPNVIRKMHTKPTALIGGVLIFINLAFFLLLDLLFNDQNLFTSDYGDFLAILIPSSLFFFLGFLDDKKDLNSYLKFILMILILNLGLILDSDLELELIKFSFSGLELNLRGFSIPFTILCFLLFINSFNMIDGINGQAALYTLIIFLIIFYISKLEILILLSIPLIFFLILNFKNKIFLGDSGTLVLGYLISFFCIKSYNSGYFEFSDEIFLIMCIPGYELLRLFIQRIFQKRDPFSADRNHLHHYVIKKYNLVITLFIMQGLFFMPFLIYLIFDSFLISLILSISTYVSLIFSLKK